MVLTHQHLIGDSTELVELEKKLSQILLLLLEYKTSLTI